MVGADSSSADKQVNGDTQPRRRSSQLGISQHSAVSSSSNSPPPLALSSQPPPNSNNQQQVTVETETVPSVPTLAVNPNLTVRVKKSQDSVPRLTSKGASKKRSLRLAQGSKADIFAAKVANAVEEQDSSDDETFVYQAPITTSHASESLRRPYMRSISNSSSHAPPTLSSLQPHNSNPYFSDEIPQFESESDVGGPDNSDVTATAAATTASVADETTNSSFQNQLTGNQNSHFLSLNQQSPRNFVVSKPKIYPQLQGSQHLPSLNKSSSSSFAYPPTHESDTNGYDEMREYPWARHSRNNSRTRQFSINESVSPTKDPYDSIRAKHSYLQRWRTPAASASHSQYEDVAPDEAVDERVSLLKGRPSLYNYQSSRNSYGRRRNNNNGLTLGQQQYLANQSLSSQTNLDGFAPNTQNGTVDEQLSPVDSQFSKFQVGVSLSTKIMVFISLVLISLLSLVFVTGVLLAAARPLREFDVVALSDVLVSDKELAFSLITQGRNPGIFSRMVDHGELDIFATSSHTVSNTLLPADNQVDTEGDSKKKARTVLLGTIVNLESPMVFHGGLSSSRQWISGSAKLVSPLANNTALWAEITAYEFDLTVKGVLAYKVLGGERKELVSRAYHVSAPEVLG